MVMRLSGWATWFGIRSGSGTGSPASPSEKSGGFRSSGPKSRLRAKPPASDAKRSKPIARQGVDLGQQRRAAVGEGVALWQALNLALVPRENFVDEILQLGRRRVGPHAFEPSIQPCDLVADDRCPAGQRVIDTV